MKIFFKFACLFFTIAAILFVAGNNKILASEHHNESTQDVDQDMAKLADLPKGTRVLSLISIGRFLEYLKKNYSSDTSQKLESLYRELYGEFITLYNQNKDELNEDELYEHIYWEQAREIEKWKEKIKQLEEKLERERKLARARARAREREPEYQLQQPLMECHGQIHPGCRQPIMECHGQIHPGCRQPNLGHHPQNRQRPQKKQQHGNGCSQQRPDLCPQQQVQYGW